MRVATDPIGLNTKFIPSEFCEHSNQEGVYIFKGGDPAAGSPTATLLRLHPSHESHRGNRLPEG